jgi:PIN domain nuclease of toxin-antitoxin system
VSRALIDTHAVLWWLTDDESLSADAYAMIADPANEVRVSIASLWEIAVKRAVGKLQATDHLPERIEAEGFSWLRVSPAHAWAVRDLPPHHRDLFDRMLIVQSLAEGLPVVTGDAVFAEYGVDVLW